MTIIKISEYLTQKEKEVILKLYILEGVDIPDIAELIDEPKRVIKEYLEQEGFYTKYQYYGIVHGHIQLTDFYSAYLHQFIMMKELKTDIFTIKRYYIHHKNICKTDNSFSNLWLFLDNQTHQFYHTLYSRGEIGNDIDSLYMFCINRAEDYLSDLERDREEEVMFNQKQFDEIESNIINYISLIKKMYKKQKKHFCKLIDDNLQKHSF